MPPSSSTGPAKRALIILLHGTACSALPDHTLAAMLARAGFVVVQPEYMDDSWNDCSRGGPEIWKTRPQDVSETIDAVARDQLFPPAYWDGML